MPFPSPRDRPDSGIKPTSLESPALASGFFTTSATWEAQVYSLNWHIKQRSIGFIRASPGGSVIKNLPANEGDMDLILGSGRSPGEENGTKHTKTASMMELVMMNSLMRAFQSPS